MLEFYTIAVIAFLAAVSPGPDFVIVAKHALTHHRQNAIFASLGIGMGILIHSTYCILGLAVVIAHSLVLFSLIKYLGAAYLIYLGIKSLLSKQHHLSQDHTKQAIPTSRQAFQDGLVTNVLNPKCTLLMLSIFTLVVKPHTAILTQASYGLVIACITTAWFVFLAYGLTLPIIKSKIDNIQHLFSKCIGVVLVVLGLAVMVESR